jgi:methylphosphotriester-DNA--protein-cysteine methyltransferase
MRVCKTCSETKEDKEFFANNVTGWSGFCKSCRRRKANAKAKRLERAVIALKEKVEAENKVRGARELENNLRYLRSAFKRFTLINRDKIKQLQNKVQANEGKEVDRRTIEAIDRRQIQQAIAESIYVRQMAMVTRGETPLDITEIWRNEYGNDTGKESEETDSRYFE